MIYYADYEIMENVMCIERNYKRLNAHTFTLVCSCPICGDSKKDSRQARFRCYVYKDSLRVGCFNCNYNKPIGEFLQTYRPDAYREWLLERRKEQNSSGISVKPKPVKKEEVDHSVKSLPFSERLDILPENHPIIKYVNQRCIPKDKFHLLYFTMEWQKLANHVKEGTFKNPKTEPRLVIPIFTKDHKVESIQGRALRKDYGKTKYMTIKTHEDASKVYGLDRADPTKPVYFLEGPIDSLFIENGCAITGGSMSLEEIPYPNQRVMVLDHEPRAKDTINRLGKFIDAGEKVVIWDRSPWKSKDINAMIQEEGATQAQIMDYLRGNTVQGLMAKMRFLQYQKC